MRRGSVARLFSYRGSVACGSITQFFRYTNTVWNYIETRYARTGCQADASEMLQEWLMVCIKQKLSACVEENVEETKGAIHILLQLLLLRKSKVLR